MTSAGLIAILGIAAAGCTAESQPHVAPDPGPQPLASQLVTWTCTGAPCPWGPTQRNHAVVWPATTGALAARLGYTVSAAIYLPAAQANGADLSIATGTATVHAGPASAVTHRLLTTIKAGESMHVSDIASGDVVSVQGDVAFTYRIALHPAPRRQPPTPEQREAAARDREVRSIAARWRCNQVPDCSGDPWPGAVVAWPEWSANQSNGRTGNVSRSVFTVAGEPLHPYMRAWAEGCEVKAEEGAVQVIEWQYGAETWRTTILRPGESHVIHLVPPENGALIEAEDGVASFRVSLHGCTPQPDPL